MMYILFMKQGKLWFYIFNTPFFYKTSHYLLALYPYCFVFCICFISLKVFFFRLICVVKYCLRLTEFGIFIYLICFHMKQPRKMKIAELQ